MTTEIDLSSYLGGKGIQYYRAAGREITTHCWWCSDGDPKGKGKLYLNTESWLYSCKRCGSAGNRYTLLEHFGDEDDLRTEGADPRMHQRLLTEACDLAHEMLIGNPSKVQYLLDRGITSEIIVAARLGFVPKNIGLSDMLPSRDKVKGYSELVSTGLVNVQGREFFNDCIIIPYFSHGQVVQLRAKFLDGKYLTPGEQNVRLYNADSLYGADRVLVVEGELDTLAVLSQIERSGNDRYFEGLAVVGVPGAGSWPEGLIETLQSQDRSKIFIGLDPDDAGEKAAAKMKAEIGNKARKVKLPSGEPKCDWTDFFLPKTLKNWGGGNDWTTLRDLLVEADLAGKVLFNIADISTKWQRHQTDKPGLKLGWPSIDGIIRPGLKPGQVMIPLAKTGTGKTVWLSNVAHNMRAKKVLYISLEMTAAEVYEHMRRIYRFWFPSSTHEEMLKAYDNLRVIEENRIRPGDLTDFIGEYRSDVGERPDVLLVDYLQYFSRGFRGATPYERVSEAIMETKAVGKEESCSFIIPSQVGRGAEHGKPIGTDDARDSGVVEETGDFLISLFRPDQVMDKQNPNAQMLPQTGAFQSQILKSRHGGKGRIASLQLSNLSLAIADKMDRGATHRIEQENAMVRQGMNYADWLKQVNAEHGQGELGL